METTCEQCAGPIDAHGRTRGIKKGNPPKYCSEQCKWAAWKDRKRATAVAERGERKCPICGNIIPDTVTLRAMCCSRECGVKYQNQKRADARRKAIEAEDRRCEGCGESIPVDRHGAIKFCSWECKHRTHNAYYRKRYRHRIRETLYGLTEDQYQAMLDAQNHACAICGSTEWPAYQHSGSPQVDHDHATGKIRGVLCGRCNLGLGSFRDDPSRLRAAADYLERK